MSFFTGRITRLVPATSSQARHYFGGPPRHRGAIPAGHRHPVHLLYDLDLTDDTLGLRFPGVTRLPLYNALQYNGCEIVYQVVSDEQIQIIAPVREKWDPTFPYENYPSEFDRVPITAEPVEYDDYKRIVFAFATGIGHTAHGICAADEQRLRELDYPFPQVGGVQFMWQDEPQWTCPNRGCEDFGKSWGTEVFAVVWEIPVPGINLWSDERGYDDTGSIQIIFSRCRGCGVIHSCNRCD